MDVIRKLMDSDWTRLAAARDRLDQPVSPFDPGAVKWCATGWLMKMKLGCEQYLALYSNLEEAILAQRPDLTNLSGKEDLVSYYNDWVASSASDINRLFAEAEIESHLGCRAR